MQLLQINKEKCAVKATAKSQLMPLGWIKRAIRLFYFETRPDGAPFSDQFVRWAKCRFPSALSV